MAIAIKQIPVLKDKDARRFQQKADAAIRMKRSIDFSKQVKTANAIIAKSKLN